MFDVAIDYNPTPKQRMFHATTADEVLFGGAAGGGKLTHIDTPIPTVCGWVKMGDISVGDQVFGMDGLPHSVTVVSPIRTLPAWKLTFDDGAEIICNDEHLWLTYNASELAALTKRSDQYRKRRRATRPSRVTGHRSVAFSNALAQKNSENPPPTKPAPTGTVRETSEIVATLTVRNGRANHAIPVAAPIQLPERELPLEPYLFGLWLGDGDSSGQGFTGIDGLEQAFVNAGFELGTKRKCHFNIKEFNHVVETLGVKNYKDIPHEYLWSSESQRLALLQGLMDTDGCCNKNGSAEFCNTNKRIIDGVAFLVRSLGMKTNIREGLSKLNGRACGPKWTIKFTPSMPVFRLQRKLDRQRSEQRRTTRFRYIVGAERLPEPVQMRCIAIDSPDHLYLAGESFIPTHNTLGVVMDAFLRCLKYNGTQACIFRRTYTELEDTVIKEARVRYPQALARYNTGRHEMQLVNGSKVLFRHCASPQDRFNYRGMEIQFLYFDELTSFEQEVYTFINTRKRAKTSMGLKPLVRSTSNPGGPGHGWVKALFVDAAPYMKKFTREIWSEQLGKSSLHTMQYIPSLAMENPYITEDYIRELENKPDAIRDALLYGNWNAFEGMAFPEFQPEVDKRDPDGRETHKWTHVIKPFDIPYTWPRYMSFDHGYSRPFSVGWWAIGPDGAAYRYREWYGCKPRQPNVGIQLSPRQIAEGIIAREEEESRDNLNIDRVADPAIFDRSRGDSVAQQMEPSGVRAGVYFRPGDNTRLAGKAQLHERMRFDEKGKALIYVFDTCPDFIRTIPALPYDLKHVEDVDTEAEDHCVTGDTLITTTQGLLAAKDLVDTIGYVVSHDGRPHRYGDCRRTQTNVDVWTLETDDGKKVTATPNHRFMLKDGTWKRLDQLQPGDELWEVPYERGSVERQATAV